jgi:hypothetical protein
MGKRRSRWIRGREIPGLASCYHRCRTTWWVTHRPNSAQRRGPGWGFQGKQGQPAGSGNRQAAEQFPLLAFIDKGTKGLQAGQEHHPRLRQGSQGIEIHPFIFKADGDAATAELPGGAGIVDLRLDHGAGQTHGRISRPRRLHMHGHPLPLGRLRQHQGQLAASNNADASRQSAGGFIPLGWRQGGISAHNHLAPAAGQSSSFALERTARSSLRKSRSAQAPFAGCHQPHQAEQQHN